MENLTNVTEERTLSLDLSGIAHLAETRKWTMFLSILGFVFIGLMLLVFIIFFIAGPAPAGFRGFSIVPMGLVSIIYFFPIYYLFLFSRNSKLAIDRNDSGRFSLAMKNLKYHYRFLGILAMIMVVLYLIAIIAMIVGGSLMRAFM